MKWLEERAVLQSSRDARAVAQRASRTLPVARRQRRWRQVTAKGFQSSREVANVRARFHRRPETGARGSMWSCVGHNEGEGNERLAASETPATIRYAQGRKAEAEAMQWKLLAVETQVLTATTCLAACLAR